MGDTTIIAGHNLGLGDTSARLLNRNDPLGKLGGTDRRATGERHRRQAKTESAFCRRCANLLAQQDGGAGIAGGKKRELVEIGGNRPAL
jgi:hypothetical protein